jgi:hypothetical protein
MTFRFAQFVSFCLSSFVGFPSLLSTVLECPGHPSANADPSTLFHWLLYSSDSCLGCPDCFLGYPIPCTLRIRSSAFPFLLRPSGASHVHRPRRLPVFFRPIGLLPSMAPMRLSIGPIRRLFGKTLYISTMEVPSQIFFAAYYPALSICHWVSLLP